MNLLLANVVDGASAFDTSTIEAVARSWPFDPWLMASLVVSGVIYLRGWRTLRRRDPERWTAGRLTAFLGGLATIFLALASPIEEFAGLLLSVHMIQHLLLMMVAPPLIWLGAPLVPMLRGLPRWLRIEVVGEVLRWTPVRFGLEWLTRPAVAWLVFVATVWLWHAPRGYELALGDPTWHRVEHLCFLLASLLFWYPVVQPYPSQRKASRWIVLPYLVLADVQNTVLSAWLAFSSVPIYSHYTRVPQFGDWSPLDDQQLAGVLMWVPGSIAFLVPVFWIGLKMIAGSEKSVHGSMNSRSASLPVISIAGCSRELSSHRPQLQNRGRTSNPAWDLLNALIIGRVLRWRGGRTSLQVAMVLLAALVIFDGVTGPSMAAANLAGIAPWIHWRGLVVLGLLVGGNFFCMACPFTLPRKLAGRWSKAERSWPRWLRSKWLAVALVGLFLWSYEAFALWDRPGLTAWIAVGYFVAAFAVDSFFRGAAFCKYVCPIGQFNFVQSLVSPLEVAVRQPDICVSCQGKECIRGSADVPGCGMQLFQPRKTGNMDCTFCLDCVQACPHENIGILAGMPGRGLSDYAARRSGIGRFGGRVDLAALVLVLVFGAFANAGGMVAPVVAWQDWLVARWHALPRLSVVSIYYLLAVAIAPLMLVMLSAFISGRWGRKRERTVRIATRYAYALLPLGASMWLAHYSFHFFTSYASLLPVSQRMLLDQGISGVGEPEWQLACCAGVADWIIHFEIAALGAGLLLSLLTAYRIANYDATRPALAMRALTPWAMLMVLLYAVGIWIVLQPMEMRGTLLVDI